MAFKSAIELFIALSFLILTLFHGYSLAYQFKDNFEEKSGPASGESCFGCDNDVGKIRARYHLKMIKERIQAELGINADGPGVNKTDLPSPMMGRLEDIFRDKSGDLSPKTEKQILLPENDIEDFPMKRRRLSFKLPPRLSSKSISVAELWVPRFIFYSHCHIKFKLLLDSKTVPTMSKSIPKQGMKLTVKHGGWLSLSLKDAIQEYIKTTFKSLLEMLGATVIIEVSYNQLLNGSLPTSSRPFVVLERRQELLKRKRRGVECHQKPQSMCCRAKLTVDFADLGLHQHIIQPRKFEAYHCVGKCGSFSRSGSTRVDIVKSVMNQMREKNQNTDHMRFCCTAARTSSVKLIYYNNEKTKIIDQVVDGLVVDECDCL